MSCRRSDLAIAVLLAALVLAGCGGGKGAVPTPPADGAQPGSDTTAGGSGAGQPAAGSEGDGQAGAQAGSDIPVNIGPLPQGAEAVLGHLVFKLNSMEARSAQGPYAGYDFLALNLTVTNNGRAEEVINSMNLLELIEPSGATQRPNFQAAAGYTGRIDTAAAPGQSATGWVGFMLKLGDGKYQLVIKVPKVGQAVYEFEAPPM